MSTNNSNNNPTNNPTNNLHRLHAEFGQSPWLDNLRRRWITDGELSRWVENGIRGLTSNPSIFQKAISQSNDYDEQFTDLIKSGHDIEAAYWDLVTHDIKGALDVLKPVYDASYGQDGFVSVEVDPSLARKTDATITAARNLHESIARPNLMVKIPGTAEGLPAIRQMIGEGRNVNVTLIFSVERYREVADAYIAGLEDLLARQIGAAAGGTAGGAMNGTAVGSAVTNGTVTNGTVTNGTVTNGTVTNGTAVGGAAVGGAMGGAAMGGAAGSATGAAIGGAVDLSGVASVASFFISRIDSEVDQRLEQLSGFDHPNQTGKAAPTHLAGKAALASGQVAYQSFCDTFSGPRWEALAEYGARPQRPLWASTSTKNPTYPDTLYVDQLIGANTVNTMPDDTLAAFADHGNLARTVDADPQAASDILKELAEVGIDLPEVCDLLETQGVSLFDKSFGELLDSLQAKALELR